MAKSKKKTADYVIVGNSVAAIAAVEAIRETDCDGSIIMVTKEGEMIYSRPMISYYLAGKVKLKNMRYREAGFYKQHNIQLLAEKKVVKVEPKKNTVKLGDGSLIGYGRLLITTGGEPVNPPIKGAAVKGVFNFTTLQDAESISRFIKANDVKSAVILGAGLIGLKAAEALLARKIKITIVELADRILATTFDKKASQIIDKALSKQGCRLELSDSIKQVISGKGKVTGVELLSGKKLAAELVVIAIGVRPNIEIVKGSGIKVKRGIVVDNAMQTNISNIYAAGDVAEAAGFFGGRKMVLAIWPDAYRQGRIAGAAMAGVKTRYQGGIVMNSVEIASVPTISVGVTVLDGSEDNVEVLEKSDLKNSIYRKIVLKDDCLEGVILVGKIDRAGIYTGLIKDRVKTTSFKELLLNEDFGIISLPKDYRKHMVSDVPMMM